MDGGISMYNVVRTGAYFPLHILIFLFDFFSCTYHLVHNLVALSITENV